MILAIIGIIVFIVFIIFPLFLILHEYFRKKCELWVGVVFLSWIVGILTISFLIVLQDII